MSIVSDLTLLTRAYNLYNILFIKKWGIRGRVWEIFFNTHTRPVPVTGTDFETRTSPVSKRGGENPAKTAGPCGVDPNCHPYY